MKPSIRTLFLAAAMLSALFSCEVESNEVPEPERHTFPEVEVTPGNLAVARKKVDDAVRLCYDMDAGISSGLMDFPGSASDAGVKKLWDALYDAVGYIGGMLSGGDTPYDAQLQYCLALLYGELHYFWGSVPIWTAPEEDFHSLHVATSKEVSELVDSLAQSSIDALSRDADQPEDFISLTRNDVLLVMGQCLLYSDNEDRQKALVCFKEVLDSDFYSLPSDGYLEPIGEFGMYAPAPASSYADVLLHTAYALHLQGDQVGAAVNCNMVLFSFGEDPLTEINAQTIIDLRGRITRRLLGMSRQALHSDSQRMFFPIP